MRFGAPVSLLAPKDSGVYGIGKARDEQFGRGSSGSEKRSGRKNATPKRRSWQAAIREFTSSPSGRVSSAVILVKAWRGAVWPRDTPSVSRLLSLAASTTWGRPLRWSGTILAGALSLELETVAPPARNGRSSPPIFYEGGARLGGAGARLEGGWVCRRRPAGNVFGRSWRRCA